MKLKKIMLQLNEVEKKIQKYQPQLPIWSRLYGVYGNSIVSSLIIASIATYKAADFNRPKKILREPFYS